MAEIVLAIGTSHSPMLSLVPEWWERYAQGDKNIRELVFPPEGIALGWEEAVAYVSDEVRSKPRTLETFREQHLRCNAALDALATTLQETAPDVTVIISDDQDEWFYENNMPSIAVYWGDSVRLIPQERSGQPARPPEIVAAIQHGYGDVEMDVPVAGGFARYLLDELMEADFDVSHVLYNDETYGGSVARRYPSRDGELDYVKTTPPRRQGLPHGFSFIVKRLFDNRPLPIVPVLQNTCYPPNNIRPARAHALGRAVADAITRSPNDARVAVIASGGLSHFVVDEEIDRSVLAALEAGDGEALRSLPRHRLFSASSEILNWVALGGAVSGTGLQMELLDYVPVHRTEVGTGGGWAFARWQ